MKASVERHQVEQDQILRNLGEGGMGEICLVGDYSLARKEGGDYVELVSLPVESTFLIGRE